MNKTYIELIEHFKSLGKIAVETDHMIMRDFQFTISRYEECYNLIIESGKNPRESLELKTRKYNMEKWLKNWETFKITECVSQECINRKIEI